MQSGVEGDEPRGAIFFATELKASSLPSTSKTTGFHSILSRHGRSLSVSAADNQGQSVNSLVGLLIVGHFSSHGDPITVLQCEGYRWGNINMIVREDLLRAARSVDHELEALGLAVVGPVDLREDRQRRSGVDVGLRAKGNAVDVSIGSGELAEDGRRSRMSRASQRTAAWTE